MSKPEVQAQDTDNERSASMLGSVREKLGLLNKTLKADRTDGKPRNPESERGGSAAKAGTQDNSDPAVKLMRGELKELFSRCPGAREVLPHLAGVEQALKVRGLAAFDSLPQRVIARAKAQLESVATEPVSAGIAELRSRIGVALQKHERIEQAASRRAGPSSFLVDEKLQVSEGSVSDFMAVLEESKRRG